MAVKRDKDVTADDALNAVEEALRIDFGADDNSGADKPAGSKDTGSTDHGILADDLLDQVELPSDDFASDDFTATGSSGAEKPSAIDPNPPLAPSSAPANDDQLSNISDLVYRLDKRPSRSIYWFAFLIATLWVGVVGYFAYSRFGSQFPALSELGSDERLPEAMLFAGLFLVPLLFIWAFAVMARRAQELRLAARSMGEAAIRLLRPESVAQDSVNNIGRAVRREVAAMGEGVERALARAGELEVLVHNEVMNLERSYTDNEIRIRTLVADMTGERELIVNHAERVRATLTGAEENIRVELNAVDGRIAEAVDNATANLSNTLEIRRDEVHARLTEANDAIANRLAASGDQMALLVNSTSEQAVERLAASGQALDDVINNRANESAALIETTGQTITQLLENRTAELERQGNDVVNRFEETVQGTATGLLTTIQETSDGLKTHLDTQFTAINDGLSSHLGNMQGALETTGSTLVESLGMRTEALDKVLADGTNAIGATIGHRLSGFSTSLNAKVDEIVNNLQERSADLEQNSERIDLAIKNRTDLIKDTLIAQTKELADTFNTGRDVVSDALAAGRGQINEDAESLKLALTRQAKEVADVFVQGEDKIITGIEIHKSEFRVRTDQLKQELIGQSEQVGSVFVEGAERVAEVIRERTDEVQARTAKMQETLADQTRDVAAAFVAGEEQIANVVMERQAEIRSRTEQIRETLTANTKDVADAFIAGEERIEQVINERQTEIHTRVEQIGEILSAQTAEVAHVLADGEMKFVKSVEARRDELTERTDRIRQTLVEQTGEIAGAFIAGEESLISRISERQDEIKSRADEIKNAMEGQSGDIASMFETAQSRLTETMQEGQKTLDNQLGSRIEQAGATLDDKAQKLSTLLSERVNVINSTLGSGLVDTQRKLEEKSVEFNTMLAERSAELAHVLETQAKPLADKVKSAGQEVTARLSETSTIVTNDVTDLLGRLGEANNVLADLLNTGRRDLGGLQSSLAHDAKTIGESVIKAKENLDISTNLMSKSESRFSETAGHTVANFQAIADRFDKHADTLSEASRLIDGAESNFSATLESRQGTIDALASGLVKRTEEIETHMQQFTELMNATLSDAQARSHEIGGRIGDDLTRAINDATARFMQTTDSMRAASAEVQRALEETRLEVRRGVLELPEETRESADAMRRVVVDQIQALKDLSEIVARSGKTLDASQASAQPRAFASASGEAAPRRPAPPRPRYDTPTAVPPAPVRYRSDPIPDPSFGGVDPYASRGDYQSEFSRQSAEANRAATDRNAGAAMPEWQSGADRTAPQARQVDTEVRAQPAPRSDQRQGSQGWVSDLLRRASSNEPVPPQAPPANQRGNPASEMYRPATEQTRPERPPLHMMETLNSLSMDIASAIDHEASVELWDRYQRGERNVFTRRLYTLKGQQTFDEIRDKYRRDAEFGSAVDRYINDFERLLADVSRNDRDNIMSQTYLTSDTGKVYTMLAHAAGRLT